MTRPSLWIFGRRAVGARDRLNSHGALDGRRAWHAALVPTAAVAVLCAPALAHIFTITKAVATIKTNGTYVVELSVDADALALGVSPTTDSATLVEWIRTLSPEEFTDRIEHAKRTLAKRVRIKFDGVKQTPTVSFPEYPAPIAAAGEIPTVLGTTARLSGEIPTGAKAFTFGASRAFNVVHLMIQDERSDGGLTVTLGVSETSPPYRLDLDSQDISKPATSRGAVVSRYLLLGYEHILPGGLDHILFVLGLFLLTTRAKPLMLQITAFTIAHSVTLGLSIYGVVSLPPRIVEPLIALSIAYVAVENVLTSELKAWRPAVVFLFGLLHGLGFADALQHLGLPREEFVTCLITFNVGVELGQLSVIALAFLTIGRFRRRPFYRRLIVIPLSLLIACVGLYWTVTRAMGGL